MGWLTESSYRRNRAELIDFSAWSASTSLNLNRRNLPCTRYAFYPLEAIPPPSAQTLGYSETSTQRRQRPPALSSKGSRSAAGPTETDKDGTYGARMH